MKLVSFKILIKLYLVETHAQCDLLTSAFLLGLDREMITVIHLPFWGLKI